MPDDATPGPAFIPVAVPVFADLARTFGYPGDCRFVRFFWEPCGDEVIYDDGRRSGTGDPYAFLAYRKHPAILPRLRSFNLGSSDENADYCLLIDQEQQTACVAPVAQGRAFVRDQHPEPEPLTPYEAQEALRHFEDALAAMRDIEISPEEISRAMQEQHQRILRMVARLNGWAAAGRAGDPGLAP